MAHRVLVVDDDRDIAAVVTELLTSEGYQVTTLHDGQQALAYVSAHPTDLIISDVRMPGMDGLALTARLRELGKAMPIILMSAHKRPNDVDRFANVTFLKKPASIDVLVDSIAIALRRRTVSRRKPTA